MQPPAPPPHRQESADRIRAWAIHEGASDLAVRQILGCLDECWLRNLPVRRKSRPWPAVPTSINFRHHWRRQVAHFLGWEKRTNFGDEVNSLLRVELWPSEGQSNGPIDDGNHGGTNAGDGEDQVTNVACAEIASFTAKTQAQSWEEDNAACETERPFKRLCGGDERRDHGTPVGGITRFGRRGVGNASSMQPSGVARGASAFGKELIWDHGGIQSGVRTDAEIHTKENCNIGQSNSTSGCSKSSVGITASSGLRILPAWFTARSKKPREGPQSLRK